MAINALSGKRALINQANSTVVIAAGVAAFIFIFSLIACKTLLSQANYQQRVIGKERTTVNQLKADLTAAKKLAVSYRAFTGTTQNALGGNTGASGAQDGDNATIVLDALPSQYDFPAMVTSLHQLLADQGVEISSISGTDDEIAQGANQTSSTPLPVPMPFTVAVSGDYKAVQDVVSAFGRSIRPIQIQKMDLSGNQDKLTLSLTAQTFYQPAKSLNISKTVVK